MVDVTGESAHEVISESIDFVLDNGDNVEVWGGTIPEEFGDDEEPNDFKREMVEYVGGFSYRLENPRKRWSEWSRHWPGITLREAEDDLRCLNPGLTPMYSKVYREWLVEDEGGVDIFPHTYGQRMQEFGFNTLTSERCKDNGYNGTSIHNQPFINQWECVKQLLVKNPTTRKACMSFWDPHVDSIQMHSETNAYVPCNVFFQLYVRDDELHWHTFSRSKDILRGSSENLFEFPLFQELMAMELSQELGRVISLGDYVEHVSNIHIYQDQIDDGYLEQNVKDPYDYLGVATPCILTDEIKSQMESVDDYLLDGDWGGALSVADEIPSYWDAWKKSLVVEYARMEDPDGIKDEYREFISTMTYPWGVSLAKRAYREWEEDWAVDAVPEAFHENVVNFS